MDDHKKTKAQLIEELQALRQQVATKTQTTDLQQLNLRLTEDLNLLRTLIDTLPDIVYVKDPQHRFLLVNQALLDSAGLTDAGDLLGKTDYDFHPPATAAGFWADEERVLQGDPLINKEETIVHRGRGGETLWLMTTKVPWRDMTGAIVGLVGVGRDITARKRVEEALNESLERYKVVTDMMSDYAFSLGVLPDGTLKREWVTGSSYTRLTGYAPFATDKAVTLNLYHPEDVPKVDEAVRKTIQGETTEGDYRIITQEGEERWLHLRRKPVWDETEGRVVRFYGVAQDVTERRQIEAALRQSEELYRAIVEDQTEFILRFTPQWVCTFANPAYIRYQADSVVGQPCWGDALPEERQAALAVIAALTPAQPTVTLAFRYQREAGTGWQEWSIRALFDVHRQLLEYQAVGSDITERQQAEQQQMELALHRQRVRLLEELISDLSHDLKTPLATINTSLYLLSKQTDPAKYQHYLDRVQTQVRRLERLVEDILIMSRLDRGGDLNFEPVQPDALIQEVGRAYQDLAEDKNIAFSLHLDHPLPPVQVSPTEMGRAVANLVENAVHYTPEGGTVTVRSYQRGAEMAIEVQDTGIGISENDLPHIFERFYRSEKARHADRGGTGLGLAIVKKIMEAHHGRIEVESALGGGSTFRLWLPVGS